MSEKMGSKIRRSSPDREELLAKSKAFASDTSRASIDSYRSTDSSYPEYGKEPKWYKSSAADASGFKKYKNGKITLKRICLGTVAGVVVLVSVLAASGVVYTTCFGPEKWESEGWYPSPKGGTVKNWEGSYKKAAKLVGQMSLVEKVNITTGTGWAQEMCVGNTGSVPGVFPSLCLQDGPLGLRFADHATAWPAGLTVGATWNKELMEKRGKLHGLEARLKGIHILLGPAMGPLGRMPAGGRNWEGFGSDPYLQGAAAAATIKGIQGQGVIATAKHFIANEQEHFRQVHEWGMPYAISSNIDDRTMHEMYLWPFADSVRAGVGSIMCSYQMTNNTYSCGNSKILNGLLKDELGFQGFVQSDWLAQRSGVDSVLAGLDMTMPGDGMVWADGDSLMGPTLTRGVLNSSIPIERLNDMATRIVATWYQMGQDDESKFSPEGPNFSSWTDEEEGLLHFGSGEGETGVVNKFIDVSSDHHKVARKIAAEATVLVKNEDSVLPLVRGLWSGKRVGIYGEDAGPGKGANFCKDRGCNQGTLASGWGSGAVEFPYLVDPLSALSKAFNTSEDDIPEISSILDNYSLKKIRKSAKEQDLCLVFANADAGEGFISDLGVAGDRNDLYAQKGGDELVKTVAESCGGPVIVVIHSVGPVIVENWVDKPAVKAIIMAQLPGQESGNALVDVLFGDENPSGKLPYTVGKSLKDYGPTAGIMYIPNSIRPQQNFSEGLLVDYRYFDKNDITPRYEFGFGLSYTSFEFSNLKLTAKALKTALPARRPDGLDPPTYDNKLPPISETLYPKGFNRVKKYIYPYLESADEVRHDGDYPYPRDYHTVRQPSPAGGGEGGNPSLWDVILEVEVTVKNTGKLDGKEVTQLYISLPDSVEGVPVRALRGFEKVALGAGESKKITFGVTRKELSWWDTERQNWILPTEGKIGVSVGRSSRDLPLRAEF
ncbi:uncharacterized protein H6S33_005521 [Morchella sextelata]|uniref:uncharacterized protein n=1 Tax=Morchella sextelata TaxID=1174677 RepID=UPI001D05A605|nr:uncharacterized protein H6S33_005521 [Morchella sextelata]KAH0613635.1 hypothetical protein H6S33_005521 [Morchella sextelata]